MIYIKALPDALHLGCKCLGGKCGPSKRGGQNGHCLAPAGDWHYRSRRVFD